MTYGYYYQLWLYFSGRRYLRWSAPVMPIWNLVPPSSQLVHDIPPKQKSWKIYFTLCQLGYLRDNKHEVTALCQTVCGRRQRSSLVVVSALLTPRRCRCRRHADLLWAIARFPWLQHGLGTVCLHRPGLPHHWWLFNVQPRLICFSCRSSDWQLLPTFWQSVRPAQRRL